MPDDKKILLCHNRGCCQNFFAEDNKEDSCTFHPGVPYFHDAYKIWPCCNKKSTDFTEFLNIKGCTTSFHNGDKPLEPEKVHVDKSKASEVIEYRAPEAARMERPLYTEPQIEVVCKVAPALAEAAKSMKINDTKQLAESLKPFIPAQGTVCKNPACRMTYEGPDSDKTECYHHPGAPIFHEGAKFWSCCKKRSFDFDAFLNQSGCSTGKHCWEKKKPTCQMNCRYDWHQTGTHVVVAVYAKRYDPSVSKVMLNPVRLTIDLYFPEDGGSFSLDLKLHGVVDVALSSASMMGTKVEVNLRKAEPGSWSRLDFLSAPTTVATTAGACRSRRAGAFRPKEGSGEAAEIKLKEDFDAVDLSDL